MPSYITYKGVTIGTNIYGYFIAWLPGEERYIQCDSLADLKRRITEDIAKQKELQCHYR